jgi:type VI secretion system protein ImpE
MTPTELFHDGRLDEAIALQTADLQSRPADPAARLFLADLYVYAARLDDAELQLERLPADDAWRRYLDAYRATLAAERRRGGLLRGVAPDFLDAPPEHLTHRLRAARLLGDGRIDDALDAIDAADTIVPWVRGHVDGREFEGLRDADELLATVLEVFVGDRYLWLGFEQVWTLRPAAPKAPLDFLYLPAELILRDRTALNVLLPTRYPGSETHADPLVRLGRDTDWYADRDGPMRGAGLRTWLVGEEEVSPLEVRQLDVNHRPF